MDDDKMAELVYDRWLKADKLTQKSLVRYTLRHCCMSVLTDIWVYFLGIE